VLSRPHQTLLADATSFDFVLCDRLHDDSSRFGFMGIFDLNQLMISVTKQGPSLACLSQQLPLLSDPSIAL
jgi:hypothetical protein